MAMLFSGVLYTIAESFPPYRRNELEKILDANGASKVDLMQATHVITNSMQFEGHETISSAVAIVSVSTEASGSDTRLICVSRMTGSTGA